MKTPEQLLLLVKFTFFEHPLLQSGRDRAGWITLIQKIFPFIEILIYVTYMAEGDFFRCRIDIRVQRGEQIGGASLKVG